MGSLSNEEFWSWHSNSSHTITHTYTCVNLKLLTHRRLKTLLWPTLLLQCTQAASFPPPLSSSLSVTHRPSPPPSRTSCPPRHRLHSAPLSTVVWALIAGEKKKKTHTRICIDQCTHHSNQHTQCTTSASRSQPCLLRLHPDRLQGSRPLRATQLHFLLLFFLSFLSMCLFLSHFLCTCLVTRPVAAGTTFNPRPLLLFIFSPPRVQPRRRGKGRQNCTSGLR